MSYIGVELATGVRLAICDSLSLATVELLKDLVGSTLESQNRKPDPGFRFDFKRWNQLTTATAGAPTARNVIARGKC